jgi:hypothetical protein
LDREVFMAGDDVKVMGWGTIIGAMVVVGLVFSIGFGVLSATLGIRWLAGPAGAAMGLTGALLIAKRQAALAARKKGAGGS